MKFIIVENWHKNIYWKITWNKLVDIFILNKHIGRTIQKYKANENPKLNIHYYIYA